MKNDFRKKPQEVYGDTGNTAAKQIRTRVKSHFMVEG
jgi:hypothetical protein